MSKNVAMFVDVANMYYAARGQDVDVDYVALLKHATKGRDLIRAYAYTGLDPENENQRKFIDFLAKNGYKPVVKDIRKFGDGRMKANLDIELVVDLFRLADRMDIAVIVSGDGDFAPAIRALQDKGVRAEVISFKPNTSSDLIAVADDFQDIMKVASISRKEGRAVRASMSAPEMPAKEVNPEFGFREASPSVAAAALAALRSGVPAGNGRRTRGASARTAAAGEAPERPTIAAGPAEALAEASEEGRRRRRRRGGRGRGRSHRDDESLVAAAPEAGAGEIGWEELDDLSQIEGLDEAGRELGFEEADPATLAELGLTPEELEALAASAETLTVDELAGDDTPAATPASEPTEAPEPRPKRRRSTRSSAAAAPEAEAAEEKPARRRSARSRPAEAPEAEAEAEAAPTETKPARRRSARSRVAEAPEAEAETRETKPKRTRVSRAGSPTADANVGTTGADGEPQGIWGRFRSARRTRPTGGSSDG